MKLTRVGLTPILILLAGMASGEVFAHSHGGHFGSGHFSSGHFGSRHFGSRHFDGHFGSRHFDGHFGIHHFHGSHVGFGVFLAGPDFWYYPPAYYYPPYYYYPSAVVAPSSPQAYIERGDGAPGEKSPAYWYYCPDTKSYYPYVKQCPGAWQRVAPQPPPSGG